MPKKPTTATHPLARGARVTVFSLLLGRRPVIEGRAVIVRPIPGEPHCYEVRFAGERRVRSRLVHPEFQADPKGTLAALLREWRASLSPTLLLDFDLLHEPRQRGSKAPRRKAPLPNQEAHP